MSGEAEQIRQQLMKVEWPKAEWPKGEHGTLEKSLAALASLESQNQALQERVIRLRVARDALDEAAIRPASPGEWEDVHNEFMDAVNYLLSPTQETEWGNTRQILTRPPQETDPE